MRTGNLLFSAAQGFFALCVFLLGVFVVRIEHAPHLRALIEKTFSLAWVGYLLLGLGAVLLVGFFFMYKGSYYRITMGAFQALIDPQLIQTLVERYWKTVFPAHDSRVQVLISGRQTLEIMLELPPFSLEEQLQILERAEKALMQLLQTQLGYNKPFVISVCA